MGRVSESTDMVFDRPPLEKLHHETIPLLAAEQQTHGRRDEGRMEDGKGESRLGFRWEIVWRDRIDVEIILYS